MYPQESAAKDATQSVGTFDQINNAFQEQIKHGADVAARLGDVANRLLNSEPQVVGSSTPDRLSSGASPMPATVESRLHVSSCELESLIGRFAELTKRLARSV